MIAEVAAPAVSVQRAGSHCENSIWGFILRMSEMPMSSSSFRLKLDNVLVATDFSAVSKQAVLYATAIARRYRSKLYVANVVTSRTERALMDAWRAGQQEIMEQLLADRLDGIEHELIVRSGYIWEVLSRLIEEKNIELVVIGTRGRTGIRKLILRICRGEYLPPRLVSRLDRRAEYFWARSRNRSRAYPRTDGFCFAFDVCREIRGQFCAGPSIVSGSLACRD